MKAKFNAPISTPNLRLESATHLTAVEDHVGLVGRVLANRAVAGRAAQALKGLKTAGLEAQERVARTQIAVIEIAVKGALVAEGIESIGALAIDIATKTGAVQSTLGATATAERLTHVANRTEAYAALEQRVAQKRLSVEEEAALKNYEDEALVASIEATNMRIAKSKEAVELCFNRALNGIAKTNDNIQ